jgi:hypothetical protein
VKSSSTSDVEMLSVVIKVVNEEGKPVEGAAIKMDGYRDNSGHYSWDSSPLGPAPQVSTNAEGTAKVSCPKYTTEKSKTREISFSVRHQEYCSVRPYDYRVDGQSPPIILRKGAIVKLSAYIGSKDNVITDIVPQISGMEVRLDGSYWKQDNDGQLTTNQIPVGPHYLRAVYFPKEGGIHFSDTVFFYALKGETSQFELELKPGLRLEGKIDSSVPRPVKNGRVVVRAYQKAEKNENNPLWWITYRTIKDDGTFVFESLPPGRAEVIAICDGFISKNPPGEKESTVLYHIGVPQTFALTRDKNEVEIAMEPTATCQVTVLDDKGSPIKDATVAFAPNVQWGQIFARRYFDSEESIRKNGNFNFKEQWERYKTDDFAAITNDEGIAIVRNLPGYSANFEVTHLDYELPIKTDYGYGRREVRAELSVGQTTAVTVTMQKKGKEFLGESDKEDKRQVNLCEPQIDPNKEGMQILKGQAENTLAPNNGSSLFGAGQADGNDLKIPAEYIGHWKGRGKIIVNWTKQQWLDINIEIKSDGTVTGQVGDSQLANAVVKLRDWLTRKFNPESNWMIRGDLSGSIIKDENITREYINLLFDDDVKDNKMKGGFHTSGWHIGDKDTMVMSGTAMVLEKIIATEKTEINKTSEIEKQQNVDVYIEDLKISPYEAGGLYTATVKIGNRGTATAAAFRLNFFKGEAKDNLNLHGKPQSGYNGAGPIKPGDFWNEQSSPFALEEGLNELTVVLDIDNDIAEANENDNQAMLKIVVKDGKIIAETSSSSPVITAEHSSANEKTAYYQQMSKNVTVDIDKSPDGSGLTVQYAIIAVCRAADVPYKWEKSAQLAEPQRRQFIEPLHIKEITARKAITDILKPFGLDYATDSDGLFIYKTSNKTPVEDNPTGG